MYNAKKIVYCLLNISFINTFYIFLLWNAQKYDFLLFENKKFLSRLHALFSSILFL